MIADWAAVGEVVVLTDNVASAAQVRAVAQGLAEAEGRRVGAVTLVSKRRVGKNRIEVVWSCWCPKTAGA